jgi:hypothetical protein
MDEHAGAAMTVLITSFRARVKGSLHGLFNVESPSGFIIHNLRLMGTAGRRSIAPPRGNSNKRGGSTVGADIVEFSSQEVTLAFAAAAVAAINNV